MKNLNFKLFFFAFVLLTSCRVSCNQREAEDAETEATALTGVKTICQRQSNNSYFCFKYPEDKMLVYCPSDPHKKCESFNIESNK